MEKKWNILMIMADQFRLTTMDGMGDAIETPNIKRIMDRGVVFDQASCTCPLCTPSRASLATGKLPHRCGVVVHDASLPPEVPTYYQELRKAGYRVGVAGKTDLHKDIRYWGVNGNLPIMYHFGFTDVFETEGKMNFAWLVKDQEGNNLPQGPYQKYLNDKNELNEISDDYLARLRKYPKFYAEPSVLHNAEDFQDSFIGRKAADWLDSVEDDVPWHYFVSFAGPHNPWDPPMEELEKQMDKIFPEAIQDLVEEKPVWVKKRAQIQTKGMTKQDLQKLKRSYAASVGVIDDWIGKLLDILERRELTQNTVVIFCADHGEMLADHGLLEKKCMYEASLRIPLVVSAPWMKQRKDSSALAQLMDLAPTCLELAGLNYNREDMDARSLLPILEGREEALRPAQISELINCQMVFDGQYKWIRNWNDLDELYDLKADPSELHNLIHERPAIAKDLMKYTFWQ